MSPEPVIYDQLLECRLPLVVLVAGMPGAGKSIVSEAARELGFRVIRMGDIIRQIAARSGVVLSDEVLGSVSQRIRELYGRDIVARVALHLACTDDKLGPVLVEGVRSLDEVSYLREHSAKCITIAVHAPPFIRYQRLLSRGRSDDPKSWEEFKARDERELTFGLGSVIALADFILINHEKSLGEVFEEAKKILVKVLVNNPAKNADDYRDTRADFPDRGQGACT